MSFGIERQSDQYASFGDDCGIYAQRGMPTGEVIVDSDVREYLAGNAITAGLLDRHAWNGMEQDPAGDPRALYQDVHDPQVEAENQGHYDAEMGHDQGPPEDPYAGHDPHATPVQPLDQFQEMHHPDDFSHYHNAEPPASFNLARRLEADGGPTNGTLPNYQSAAQVTGAIGPAQPVAPAEPVWLGHTFVPGQRVGMPWHDTVIPGTVVGLEGTNVAVLWDDHQFTVEEPSGIQQLY